MNKKIVMDHFDEIVDKLYEAHECALNNRHMQFSVYLYPNGEIYIFSDVAGGNSFLNDDHEVITTFDYSHEEDDEFDIDPIDIIRYFVEQLEVEEDFILGW